MKTRLSPLASALFALFFFASQNAFSQSQITGTITNSKGDGIFFATVALHKQADSTVVMGEATNEAGKFTLKNIPDGQYFIQVNMLGYLDERVGDINLPADNRKNFDLSLDDDAKTLATVEVTAKAPLLEQRADRLIVNVENNLTSLNMNLLDVLKKVPGVLVVGDKLRMAGQSNVTILLNGKTTKYMDVDALLKDIPGDNIKRVEVIHQPGAEFEAEGTGPIINIITKKNSLFGTNGSLNAGIGKGENWRYNSSLNLSHYQGNVNINGGLGAGHNAWYEELNILRKVGNDVYKQNTKNTNPSNYLYGNLALDWDVTDRHRIGFSSRWTGSHRDYTIKNTTDVDYADATDGDLRLLTDNQRKSDWKMFTINPYYTFTIDTNGQKLDFDVNVARINSDGSNRLQPKELNYGLAFPGQLYEQPGSSKIFTTSLDYTYPFTKEISLQAGGRYSKADLDNDLRSSDEDSSGVYVPNPQQSNHFLFKEDIAAGYAKLNWKASKWAGTAGLRYEDSQSEGYSVTLDSTQNRHIGKLFPSASLSREITKKLGASVAYSYRIDRPSYGDLNPFVYYLDPYTYELGNPRLRPSLTHSTKFNLTYENQPFFNVEYKYTSNAMVEVTQQNDATGETFLTHVNLEAFKVLNISLFFPLDFIPKVSGYGGFIANYGQYDSPFLGEQFRQSKWDYTAFLQANFKLPGKVEAEVSGWWNSGPLEGIINSEWLYGTDFGVSRKFLDEKLKLSLGVENLFYRFYHGQVRYANMSLDVESRWDAPVYNFKLNYKFGNQHMKDKSGRQSSAADELRRAKQD
ncbi:MAG: TonB-dependent receptor [Saprospiraceae bacterium]|nr:TonB-dependent receptor [Saprospiraceae bacterium]MCF8251286.1 TonB-dependent receptor [Saprospiraceae bacterium]MCF8280823.1 TonB-dependent receptor [Bacteroidales bacterium]MCF8311823.1 TonB-dependent receptor [Saprospiraceae bacterium]MCF8441964.1 TonB-dependent receptor [Saprospiraceae bacterium]